MSASIEIKGRSLAHPSVTETDFVVLGDSPNIQLSVDGGDILSGLDVPSMTSCFNVESVNLKSDIERLTKENTELKRTATENMTSLKKHLELCTSWRDQMNKCHERDATMIEEARLATLKLKEERDNLEKMLENTQKKLEDMIIEKYRLDKVESEYQVAVEELKKQLLDAQEEVDDMAKKAVETSFVHVQDDSPQTQQVIEDLNAELETLKKQLEDSVTADGNPIIADLVSEVESLKKLLEETKEQNDGDIEGLREKLSASEAYCEMTIEKLKKENEDLLDQISQDKATWEVQREMRVQQLNAKVSELEKDLGDAKLNERAFEQLRREKEELTERFSQTKLALDNAVERKNILTRELKELEMAHTQSRAQLGDVDLLKQQVASLDLLRKDQDFQIDALREALRAEGAQRQKVESEYNDLLVTWQNFEQNQPVMVAPPVAQSAQIEQAALEVATADKVRLENEVRSLRDTVQDLQTQNTRLMEQQRLGQPQRPQRVEELSCPICMQQFTDRQLLITHADLCLNEAGTM